MKININIPEEMQIVGALQDRIIKLKQAKQDKHIKSMIENCKSALEKIEQANYEKAQEIMRNEG
jgi:hypothetical protein